MGAEIGNSTQKLHARGPIGLRELTTIKYVLQRQRPDPGVGAPSLAIGVLGGAFNPPHIGHLVLAHEAASQLGLERVLLVPAGEAPHRRDRAGAGPGGRLEMARLAARDDELLEVSRRGGAGGTARPTRSVRSSCCMMSGQGTS